MSTAAILLLTKEVAGLSDIPAGPVRAAACARPRRRCWEALARIQRSLRALSGVQIAEGWQHDQAREASDCCSDLLELVQTLQDHDRESGESHWAATDYAALLDEVQLQLAAARQLLGEDGADGELSAPTAPLMKLFAKVDSIVSEASSGDSASEPTATPKEVVRKPVRLSIEELQDEYPHCEWAVNGTCNEGCTVGGCKEHAHLAVEAW